MQVLSAAELLTVWERGLSQSWVQRALSLLAASCPEQPIDELAKLSIGQRDAKLLTLREWILGPQVVSQIVCVNCRAQVELNFEIADIRSSPKTEALPNLAIEKDDYTVAFRLPNSWDMAATAQSPRDDIDTIADQLLRQCVVSIQYQGQALTANRLPTDIAQAVLEHMEQADPQANVQLAIACPECGHEWQALFDIVSFFWTELDAWARRLLMEVHTLASTYGWHEAEILAMSAQRRQFYLEMIRG